MTNSVWITQLCVTRSLFWSTHVASKYTSGTSQAFQREVRMNSRLHASGLPRLQLPTAVPSVQLETSKAQHVWCTPAQSPSPVAWPPRHVPNALNSPVLRAHALCPIIRSLEQCPRIPGNPPLLEIHSSQSNHSNVFKTSKTISRIKQTKQIFHLFPVGIGTNQSL